VTKGVFF